MVAPISGARAIHSLTGPAIATAAIPKAASAKATIANAVIQGETPRFCAKRMTGASVIATTAAAKIGRRMARPT